MKTKGRPAKPPLRHYLVASGPGRPFLFPAPFPIEATAVLVSSVAVAVLAPSGVTALFIPTPIFIPALVIAALRVTTALLVNCPVPLLLPGIGPLTRQHLILKHSADVTDVLRRRWARQHSHGNGYYHKISHLLLHTASSAWQTNTAVTRRGFGTSPNGAGALDCGARK